MTSNRDHTIVCSHVDKAFEGVAALTDFGLRAPTGAVLGLLGPSGSGKTTALRVIAGFERPDSGTVSIAGRTVVDTNGTWMPPEKRRVGMVFQDYALFPHLSVAKNIAYGLAKEKRSHRVAEVLSMVGLSSMGDRLPHELSGGEQQRVALARALAPSPDVVLLDEPFSNLDAPQRERVRREVRTILVEARTTAIFVTHDQEEALAMSDAVAVMRNGTVVQASSPHDIYTRPADCWVARFLGEAEFVAGTAAETRVETPLGTFANDSGLRGEVEVMIRPEAVALSPDTEGTALVVAREFYGHDQLVTLQVEGGTRLLARVGPDPIYHPGDTVSFLVRNVAVFPAHAEQHETSGQS